MESTGDDLDQHGGRGRLSRFVVTLAIGIPTTAALLAALSVYCTFQFVAFAVFPKTYRKKLAKEDGAATQVVVTTPQAKLEQRS